MRRSYLITLIIIIMLMLAFLFVVQPMVKGLQKDERRAQQQVRQQQRVLDLLLAAKDSSQNSTFMKIAQNTANGVASDVNRNEQLLQILASNNNVNIESKTKQPAKTYPHHDIDITRQQYVLEVSSYIDDNIMIFMESLSGAVQGVAVLESLELEKQRQPSLGDYQRLETGFNVPLVKGSLTFSVYTFSESFNL